MDRKECIDGISHNIVRICDTRMLRIIYVFTSTILSNLKERGIEEHG